MKVITFGASSSKNSINQQLAIWVANQIKNAEIESLSLIDFEMPIFSVDKEREDKFPEKALNFASKIDSADLLIISLAEHNGSYSTAFKNIMDWVSRIPNRKVWGNKNMLLLSTSPGQRGGASVLEAAMKRFPHDGGNIIGSISLPSFGENFNPENGVINEDFNTKLNEIINNLN